MKMGDVKYSPRNDEMAKWLLLFGVVQGMMLKCLGELGVKSFSEK